MSPAPPLTDPDERISRIRFFTRKFRLRSGEPVNDLGCGQGMPREHGSEALPRQIAMTTAPPEPLPPNPLKLVAEPAEPLAVARDAVIGDVAPDHSRQMRMLRTERQMQIESAPLGHAGKRPRKPIFRRDLPDHVLAILRSSPKHG